MAVLAGGGLLLYLGDGARTQAAQISGPSPGFGYLTVRVLILKTDPAARSLTAEVDVQAFGGLSQLGDPRTPASDLVVDTTSPDTPVLTYKAGQPITQRTLTFGLLRGRISDFPFDRYPVTFGFAGHAPDVGVPVVTFVSNGDSSFLLSTSSRGVGLAGGYLFEQLTRSRGTLLLAWFMMAVMWGLAVSVAVAAWLVVGRRRGIEWSALSWMAATLFALVALRGAAPGDPPIGCVMDYAAFFPAEALIAVSLVAVVVRGVASEPQPTPADTD